VSKYSVFNFDILKERQSDSESALAHVPMMAAAYRDASAAVPTLRTTFKLALTKLFLESTFKDQINPKRQTAGPPEGGSPELDLALPL
jgi:hypothetical protein